MIKQMKSLGKGVLVAGIGMGTIPASSHGELTLVDAGQPRAVVLVPDQPDQAVLDAARELNYWVHRISGVELEVREEAEWDDQTPALSVGMTRFAAAEGLTADALRNQIGPEGAVVRISDRYALLAARERPDYAVMEFVKQALGVRLIMPGTIGEVFEPRTTLTVAAGEWVWDTELTLLRRIRSGFFQLTDRTRERLQAHVHPDDFDTVWGEVWPAVSEDNLAWLRRQRIDVGRLTIGHAFTRWWGRYGQEHPEWFALSDRGERVGGRNALLCISNPEVAQRIFEERRDDIAAGHSVTIAPNDSRRFCTCDDCRAWDPPQLADLPARALWDPAPELVLSDRYLRLWNKLAEKATEVRSDAVLTTWAYFNYEHPPLTDIRVHPNLYIGLVTGEGFYPDEPVRDNWRGWFEAGAQNMVWRPNVFHNGHGMPYVTARHLGSDIHFFHRHNIKGADFDSLMGHWATQGIDYYVTAEALTRPDADVETLLTEYYDAFGAAAPAVRAYFEYLQDVTDRGPQAMRDAGAVTQGYGTWNPAFISLAATLFTDEVLTRAADKLQRAAELAASDRPVIQERVAFLRTGLEHATLTARTVAAVQRHVGNPTDPSLRQVAYEQQEVLHAFRRQLLLEQPQAINVLDLTNRELRYRFVIDTPAANALNAQWSAWTLRLDPEERGIQEAWYLRTTEPGEDYGWRIIPVGAFYHQSWPGYYHGYAWYHASFELPAGMDGAVSLHFGGVDEQAWVYVNGHYVGEHTVAATGQPIATLWNKPFDIPVPAEILNPDGPNDLVVRVHTHAAAGGIHGPVTIRRAEEGE